MLKQFKYAFRAKQNMRLLSFAILVLVNIIMWIGTNLAGDGGARTAIGITAIVFSSLALCGWFIICVLADNELIRGLFIAPKGYHVLLTPVSGRKILGGRLLAIVIPDLTGFAIGVIFIVIQSVTLANVGISTIRFNISSLVFLILGSVISYTLFILYIYLIAALAKSIFYSHRAGLLFGILTTIGAAYILSLMNIILVPFASTDIYGLFINISVHAGWNMGMLIYLLLGCVKAGILFAAVTYLIERRVNI